MRLREQRGALIAAAVVAFTIGAGCGSGFDRDEATVECDADRDAFPNCYDDATFEACIVCHEECGAECATLGQVCPTKYSCPEE